MGLSVAFSLLVVWSSIASAFQTNWPVGFFVGTFSAGLFGLGRLYAWWQRRFR